jgi:hypothetical protein
MHNVTEYNFGFWIKRKHAVDSSPPSFKVRPVFPLQFLAVHRRVADLFSGEPHRHSGAPI